MTEQVAWQYVHQGMWVQDPTGRNWKVVDRNGNQYTLQSNGQQRSLTATHNSAPATLVEHPNAEAEAIALLKSELGAVIL